MTELENIGDYLKAEIAQANRELGDLRIRIDTLMLVKSVVESAIDREKNPRPEGGMVR